MHTMKTKSMFFKILKYFLLTTILPCMTVIFLCGYAEKSVKDQVISSNERTLGQFFSLVDNVMDDITHRCLEISVDDVCNDYIRAYVQNPREAEHMTIHVYKKLGEFADNKLSDVLVYFPTADRIISGVNGSLPTEDYLASNLAFLPLANFFSRQNHFFQGGSSSYLSFPGLLIFLIVTPRVLLLV